MKKIIWMIVAAIIVLKLPNFMTLSLPTNPNAIQMPGESLLELEPGDYYIFIVEQQSLWLMRFIAIGLSIFLLGIIILFLIPGKKKATNNTGD